MRAIQKRINEEISDTGLARRFLDNSIARRGVRMAISAVVFLLVWEVLSTFYFQPTTLPSLTQVAAELFRILEMGGPRGRSASFHLEKSLVRVLIAATVGMSLAVVLGVLMGINEHVEDALALWLPFWMTVPTVVVVLITMIMFQFSDNSVLVAVVFAATPYATINTWKGVQTIDTELLQMADAFNFDQRSVWRHIYLPGILPALFGSLRYLFSMVWKIVVLAEVFGINNGMGAMFRFWYNQGQIVTVLAYLSLFIGVMFLIEYVILYPLEQYLFRWRDS